MGNELRRRDLVHGWRRAGLSAGMTVLVHSSLSSLGRIDGGAATVVASLREAVGSEGTVVVPAFTRHVRDPDPDCVGVPDEEVHARRASVPLFHRDMPTGIGAIPETLRGLDAAYRSPHPQASVAAVGANASLITSRQSLGFAVGRDSPFGQMYDLGASVLLIGIGHNRNTFLHYAESLTPRPRLKLRRFPALIGAERVWQETLDVGNDNDTYFPLIGREFEQRSGNGATVVGEASCRLVSVQALVDYAIPRLTQLLAAADTPSASESHVMTP